MAGTSMKLPPETTARQLIKVNTDVIKYGLLRKKSSKALFENWPFRFVVLLTDSIRVYQDENTHSPNSVLEFHEYNQVVETTSRSYDCCFSVLSKHEAGSTSSRHKIFSCLGEDEMKEWITAIRRAMNPDVKNESKTAEVIVGDLYRDEHEYSSIGDIQIKAESVRQATLNSVGITESFRKVVSVTAEPPRTESIRRLHCNSLPIDSSISSEPPSRPRVGPQPMSRPASAAVSSGKVQSAPRRAPPKPPQNVPPYNPESDLVLKTHPLEVNAHDSESKHIYDQIGLAYDGGSTLDSIYSEYKFTPPNGKSSLVGDSTITDKFPDRDKCVALLKSTREPGAYLVRNSRQGKQQVLAFLSERGEVVEYILYEEGSKVTINHSSYFGSLEELLEHYSTRQLTKGTGEHLKKGIHLVVRSRKPKV
ncbi:unnamed protein product [Lymnaea stagnalis]|uniref:Uncharacterized protein n=1 Tax=Lymnaea stagnalis TaxID=6523 RepID=A0AAV2HCM9_LYMST